MEKAAYIPPEPSRIMPLMVQALIDQANQNSEKARAIMDLYVRLKDRVIELTHSKFAVPMLDILFVRPLI